MANGSDLSCAALKRTYPSIAGQQQGILQRRNPIYPMPVLHTVGSTGLSRHSCSHPSGQEMDGMQLRAARALALLP